MASTLLLHMIQACDMEIIYSLAISALAVGITSYLLPGVTITGYITAVLVAILLAILNTFLKPVLIILTLPVNIVTIGLFTFVINAGIVMLVSNLVK